MPCPTWCTGTQAAMRYLPPLSMAFLIVVDHARPRDRLLQHPTMLCNTKGAVKKIDRSLVSTARLNAIYHCLGTKGLVGT